jgi:hypothetical protein
MRRRKTKKKDKLKKDDTEKIKVEIKRMIKDEKKDKELFKNVGEPVVPSVDWILKIRILLKDCC